MLYLVLTIILLLALHYYRQGKMAEMLICMTALGTNLFQFSSLLGGGVKVWDIALLTNFCLLFLAWSKDTNLFSLRGDKLAIIISILFGYITISFIVTIAFGIDSFTFALKTYRPYTILLFYFILRKIPIEEYERYINLLLKFAILQGVFFYLQLVGITGILGGYTNDIGTDSARFGNYPFCYDFFILYFILKRDIKPVKRIFMLVFFGMMPIIGQMRGAILAVGAAFVLYMIIQRQKKNILYLLIGLVLYQFVISPVFAKRDEGHSISTKEELVMVLTNPRDVYKMYTNEAITGNMAFRIATLTERIMYLEDNPKYLPFGVGCIFEDSPQNRFDFMLGTYSSTYDRIGQLGSSDIAWVCVFMHFGFVGALLFLLLIYHRFKITIPFLAATEDTLFIVFSLQTIIVFLLSFDSENLGRVGPLIYMCIACAYIQRYVNEQEKIIPLTNKENG